MKYSYILIDLKITKQIVNEILEYKYRFRNDQRNTYRILNDNYGATEVTFVGN